MILEIRNRQRRRRVDRAFLDRVARWLVEEWFDVRDAELCFHLVGSAEMTRVNRAFLAHEGSTDVITFDHQEAPASDRLHGEAFLCMDDAVEQARRFRTTWASEVVRYLIHALLHLRGYDDHAGPDRRRMKRAETLALRAVSRRFPLSRLAARHRPVRRRVS